MRSCIVGLGFDDETGGRITNRDGLARCFLIVHTTKLPPAHLISPGCVRPPLFDPILSFFRSANSSGSLRLLIAKEGNGPAVCDLTNLCGIISRPTLRARHSSVWRTYPV